LKFYPSHYYSDDVDIEKDFEEMVSFVIKMVSNSSNFSMQPIITRFRNIQDSGIPKTRFYLIRCFETILGVLYLYASPDRLAEGAKELQFYPIGLEGIWKADERNEYWKFVATSDIAFFAFRYSATENEIWLYDRYELLAMVDGDQLIAIVNSPDVIDDLLGSGHISPEHQSFLGMGYDDIDHPGQIELFDDGLDGLEIACTLTRLKEKEGLRLSKTRLEKAVSVNSYKEYELVSNAYALTYNWVFFPVPDQEGLYYRLPRTDGIYPLSLDDYLVLKTKEKIIIGSGANLVYFDVTTEEKRKKSHIIITDRIQN